MFSRIEHSKGCLCDGCERSRDLLTAARLLADWINLSAHAADDSTKNLYDRTQRFLRGDE